MDVKGLDPALAWLYRSLNGDVKFDTPEFLKKKIFEKLSIEVAGLLYESGQRAPPFQPELLTRSRKIKKIIHFNSRGGFDGILKPVNGGFVVKLNSSVPLTRYRFACAHEIGHTFFYDLNSDPPVKAYLASQSNYWVEEGIARKIAGEILMPEFSVKRVIRRFGMPSLDAFKKISGLYLVSHEALAKRLFWDLKLWDGLLLVSNVVDKGIIKIYKWGRFVGPSFQKMKIPLALTSESKGYSDLYLNLISTLNENPGEITSPKHVVLGSAQGFLQSFYTNGDGEKAKHRIFSMISKHAPSSGIRQLNLS